MYDNFEYYLYIDYTYIVRWTVDGYPTSILPMTATINEVTHYGPEMKKKQASPTTFFSRAHRNSSHLHLRTRPSATSYSRTNISSSHLNLKNSPPLSSPDSCPIPAVSFSRTSSNIFFIKPH